MARKGQAFQKYTEELKREAVRLRVEEGKSLREIREHLGIKSDAQIIEWVKRLNKGRHLMINVVFGTVRILIVLKKKMPI